MAPSESDNVLAKDNVIAQLPIVEDIQGEPLEHRSKISPNRHKSPFCTSAIVPLCVSMCRKFETTLHACTGRELRPPVRGHSYIHGTAPPARFLTVKHHATPAARMERPAWRRC